MNFATYIVIGLQIVLCLVLIVVVLMQNGNQRGLSGSIAGGAETFFGKNKGRTLDAKLKKWTSVIAVLFLLSSIVLGFMIDKGNENEIATTDIEAGMENENAEAPVGDEGEAKTENEAEGEAEGEAETEAEAEKTAE